MRWGTYSDMVSDIAGLLIVLVSIAHALGNLFRPE